MDHTARLDFPFIMPGQALKHITHNEALQRLDILVQPVVVSAAVATPPATPMPGEAWIVPSGASGAWSGHTSEITSHQAGAWTFCDPAEGWQVYDCESGSLMVFTGANWVPVASIGDGLPQLGVNATADSSNRLTVAADATLLTHAGTSHRLKLNKASSADTASLLFQSNWSGRAEMGLMGDGNWRIKVSTDGSVWTDALSIDAGTSIARFAGSVRPLADNTQSLGASGARWSAIWSGTGTIQTSDIRQKAEIAPSDLGLDLIRRLQPIRFRWRETDDGRTHYGFAAQAVAEAVTACGVRDFGGHVLSDPADPDSAQALRYDQFIAPLIAAVQELAARIEALEAA